MSSGPRRQTEALPLWVFAYGSLMWNPGFAARETQAARLHGFHRAFCIYSEHYRGTPQKPGLILGLLAGGSCRGLAHRLPAKDYDARAPLSLDQREIENDGVYVEETSGRSISPTAAPCRRWSISPTGRTASSPASCRSPRR